MLIMIIINNQKITCWGGKCEESGMVNCIRYEIVTREKMKRRCLTAHPTADHSLILGSRDTWECCNKWLKGSGWNDSQKVWCFLKAEWALCSVQGRLKSQSTVSGIRRLRFGSVVQKFQVTSPSLWPHLHHRRLVSGLFWVFDEIMHRKHGEYGAQWILRKCNYDGDDHWNLFPWFDSCPGPDPMLRTQCPGHAFCHAFPPAEGRLLLAWTICLFFGDSISFKYSDLLSPQISKITETLR